jgi:CrcB protein
MLQIIFVAAGGATGAVTRYLITLLVSRLTHHSQVYTGTVIANAAGCFLAGLLLGYLSNQTAASEAFMLFFSVGFLGSLTTFSTFALEYQHLLNKPLSRQMHYLSLQLGTTLAMAILGATIGKVLTGGSLA